MDLFQEFIFFAVRVWVLYLAMLGAFSLLGADPRRFVPLVFSLVTVALGWFALQLSIRQRRQRLSPHLSHLTRGRRVRVVAGNYEGRPGYIVDTTLSGLANVVLVDPTPDELPHVTVEPALLKLADCERW